jgi:RNA polymerase sigma-70 factor (ECF subfamily)
VIKNEVPRRTLLKALENQNLTNQSDERLQVEAARQDPARFAELYEDNFERVYAYVARRVGNREEAQDVTADVFHQALVGLPRFEWRGLPFVAWLLGIAANVLSDRWQRTATHQEAVNDDLDHIGIEDDIEQRAMLYQLVDTLPDVQRRVSSGASSDRRVCARSRRNLGAARVRSNNFNCGHCKIFGNG